jgi:carbonic anhydrase
MRQVARQKTMDKLADGIAKFQRNVYPKHEHTFRKLAEGQNPFALLITCADSRIVPEMFLQCEPGDLFVCRNAGNIVPPYDGRTDGVAATVEYAVDALKIPNIIVAGHFDCGAMKGLLAPDAIKQYEMTSRWLRYADATRRVVNGLQFDSPEERLRFTIEENVLAQLINLTTHPSVAAGLRAGKLALHGWYMDLPNGALNCYDEEAGRFTPYQKDFPSIKRLQNIRVAAA